MSQENVELTRQAVDAFNQRDLDAYLHLIDDDVVFVAGGATMEGDYHGRAGVRRYWENMLDALPDLTIEIIDLRDLGDRTLAAGRVRGHGAGSDTPFDETFWGITEWRERKCVRWANFGTEAEALDAVGLRE